MYKERRKKLAAALPDNAIALLFSKTAPYKVGDEKYEFSVDRSFYYKMCIRDSILENNTAITF